MTFTKLIRSLLVVATVAFALSGAPLQAQDTHGLLPSKDFKALSLQGPAAQQKFDGKVLYKAAFETLRDYHLALADSAVRAKWAAEWENKHANDGALNTEAGTDAAIREMVRSLNQRFDSYHDPDAVRRNQQQIDPSLVGIGTTLRLRGQEDLLKNLPPDATAEDVKNIQRVGPGHEIVVEEPFEGGPAEKAGLRPGDIITKVDGQPASGRLLDDVVNTIRGQANTIVTLTIERTDDQGKTSELTLRITRARVVAKVVKSVDLGDGITHIRLKDFVSQYAVREMNEALRNAAGGKAVIIDLRDNAGGRLDYVLYMSATLLKEGTILVTEDRDGGEIREHTVVARPHYILHEAPDDADPDQLSLNIENRPALLLPEDMPIVVLTNERSYSASEILSGALQGNHRAIVVGKPTGGKGVGQSVINLPFGRQINVTTFEFLPAGKRMDWIGVIPDIDIDQPAGVKEDKQLEAARQAAQDLVRKREALEAQRQDLKRQNEEEFKKFRGNSSTN